MKIELLQSHEHNRLRDLRLRTLKESPAEFSSSYQEQLDRPSESWQEMLQNFSVFAATVNNKDVGIVRGAHCKEDSNCARLHSLWVDPEEGGKGIGEVLIQAVINWARTSGRTKLFLEVVDHNPKAIGLYYRLAFKPDGTTSCLPAPREHIQRHQRSLKL